MVPWSQVTIGGWHILKGKGSTEFGIGTTLKEVAKAILCDERKILPVLVLLTIFARIPPPLRWRDELQRS